jgi:hypothetical protein
MLDVRTRLWCHNESARKWKWKWHDDYHLHLLGLHWGHVLDWRHGRLLALFVLHIITYLRLDVFIAGLDDDDAYYVVQHDED